MSWRNWSFGAVVAVLLAVPAATHAARDIASVGQAPSSDELVVFEVENCVYCALFRRDVLPSYRRWRTARAVPIRFVNARSAELMRTRLAAPVTAVPTFVVMREGREVGRISGYTGPGPFFQMIRRIMQRAD